MALVNGPESFVIYKYIAYALGIMVWILSYPALMYITKSGKMLSSMQKFFDSDNTVEIVIKLSKLANTDLSVLDKFKDISLDIDKMKKLIKIAEEFSDIQDVENYIRSIQKNMRALVSIIENERDDRDFGRKLKRSNIDDDAISILEEKYGSNNETSDRRQRLTKI